MQTFWIVYQSNNSYLHLVSKYPDQNAPLVTKRQINAKITEDKWFMLMGIVHPNQYHRARVFQHTYNSSLDSVKFQTSSNFDGWKNAKAYFGGIGGFNYSGFAGKMRNLLLFPEYEFLSDSSDFNFLLFNNFPWGNYFSLVGFTNRKFLADVPYLSNYPLNYNTGYNIFDVSGNGKHGFFGKCPIDVLA